MFDAKKLLDALGTPAAAPAPASPPPAQPSADSAKAPSPPSLGAGTLLSDLIGLANRPDPVPETPATPGEPAPKPAKPASPPPPADLTDLLLGKAQEYLKTPQGNAVVTAAVVGLTKFVANSETGRKLGASAMSKGSALFNRFVKKSEPDALLLEASEPPPVLAPPEDVADTAILVLRAMIAAAASDGRIDDAERQRILGALKAGGIDGDGARLIEQELDNPASPADLAAAARTPAMAVQAYTAARRIITPTKVEERVFLAHLSAALGLDARVVAQIDASASDPA